MGHDEENFGKKTFFITSSYFPEISKEGRKNKNSPKVDFHCFAILNTPDLVKSVDQGVIRKLPSWQIFMV